jgi:hypothetical protein
MFTCQNKGDYLFAEASGPYSLEVLMSTIHQVAKHCRKENLNKAVIDLRNMEGDPSILDRYRLGIEIANVWKWSIKVAVIARAEVVNHMSENTAVNRGARMLTTSNESQAMEWLGVEK